MKRSVIAALAAAALLVPAGVVAQDESPEASMAPIGVTTFDVCLAISGPVIQLTPEALTQGISDGTFVIEGMSSDCENGLMGEASASDAPMEAAESPEAVESDG
jgi:hypothetical protein